MSEVKLDVPTDAYLPKEYVTKEELRLEAYRRLAGVTTASEVDDIRAEWEDRYGPVPPEADALLDVGYLRAECHRLGLKDVSIQSNAARLAPLRLKVSEDMRLKRLARTAILKDDTDQLVVPIARGATPARFVVGLLRELIPPDGPPTGGPNTVAESIPAPAGGRVISSRPR